MISKEILKKERKNYKKNKMDFTGVFNQTWIHTATNLGGGGGGIHNQRKEQVKTKHKRNSQKK